MMHRTRITRLLMLLALLWQLQPTAHAQAQATPFLVVTDVDTSQSPGVQLTVVGGNLARSLASAPVTIYEDDGEQTVVDSQTVTTGLQLAVALDPNGIFAPGPSGQPYHAEVVGAVLDLVQSEVVTRNLDLLAAYTLLPGVELDAIQVWTKEPNLIFNSIVQYPLVEQTTNAPLTGLLLQVLDSFADATQTPQQTRTLLLFTAGTATVDVEAVLAKAHEQRVYLQVVVMGDADQSTAPLRMLRQLVAETHGELVVFNAVEQLQPLWSLLADLRTQRTLVYNPSSPGPANVRISLALRTGAAVETAVERGPTEAANLQPATTTATPKPTAALAVAGTQASPAAAVLTPTNEEAPAVTPTAQPVAKEAATSAPTAQLAATEAATVTSSQLPIPAGLLWLALPALVALVAYGIYRLWGAALTQTSQGERTATAPGVYTLSETSKLLPPPKHKTPAAGVHNEEDFQVQSAEPLSEPLSRPTSRPRPAGTDDEATFVGQYGLGDDEATYRLSEEIEQPIIGYFVRVTSNPVLPMELPIYGLNPTRGEVRQIHIGRHSKNNTVVINDNSISREHAAIVQRDGRLYLRDNASTAGTFLNWRRLRPGEELLLRHNDLVSFGEIVYEFHAKGEDEATVAAE